MLPDGEIEAAGTRFTVDVVLGRTKSVSVADGRVVLRRRDDRELTLHAGEGWSRTEPAAAEAIVAAEAAPAAASGGPTERPRRIATKSAARASTSAGERFDEAISSFVHGSYARADTQLIDFVREFPHDSRCEDASFLSAVARWRMGDASGARTQAQSYLGAYPQGLRRDEAQHIVDAVR
jgi:TolA-binding protein